MLLKLNNLLLFIFVTSSLFSQEKQSLQEALSYNSVSRLKEYILLLSQKDSCELDATDCVRDIVNDYILNCYRVEREWFPKDSNYVSNIHKVSVDYISKGDSIVYYSAEENKGAQS
jgi:hypothetical protein